MNEARISHPPCHGVWNFISLTQKEGGHDTDAQSTAPAYSQRPHAVLELSRGPARVTT